MNSIVSIGAPGLMVAAAGFCVLSYLKRRRHPESNSLFKSPQRRKQLQLVAVFFVGFGLLSFGRSHSVCFEIPGSSSSMLSMV